MDGGQARFLEALEQLDDYLSRRRVKQADRLLDELRQMASRDREPAVQAQMQTMVKAQATRLQVLRRLMQAERIDAAARRRDKPPNSVCEKCGQPYRRGKKETGRQICSICRPVDSSRSIRALGGGLPTLGKRRK